MEARKIDRLFRNGLQEVHDDQIVESWSKMEQMLEGRESSVRLRRVWWIASCVALLLVSVGTYVSYESREKMTMNPMPKEKGALRAKKELLVTNETKSEEKKVVSVVQSEEPLSTVFKPVKKEKSTVLRSLEPTPERVILEEPNVIVPSLENNGTKVDKPEKRMPVRITYKRSNRFVSDSDLIAKNQSDTSKQKKLKQFFEKNYMDPNEMWADIRDAKNRLVQKAVNFNNKKLKNSKTKNK